MRNHQSVEHCFVRQYWTDGSMVPHIENRQSLNYISSIEGFSHINHINIAIQDDHISIPICIYDMNI